MSAAGARTLRLLLAPIAPLLADPHVTEVVINRPGEVGCERRGEWTWAEAPELTYPRLDALATLAAALGSGPVKSLA